MLLSTLTTHLHIVIHVLCNGYQTCWRVQLASKHHLQPRNSLYFLHLGIPGDPYLPCYQYHPECYNHKDNPFLTPPLKTHLTHGIILTPNLSLLADRCNIWQQLACLREEHKASEHNEEHTHKVPPPSLPPPSITQWNHLRNPLHSSLYSLPF